MTPEQLAEQFEKYAFEGFDAPAGSVTARIADAWSCAARLVRTSLVPTGDPVRALAAECDRLKAELSQAIGACDGACRIARVAIEANDNNVEVIKQLRYSLKLAEASNGALRGMVDTLTAEKRTLKQERVPSIVKWAREVGSTNQENT